MAHCPLFMLSIFLLNIFNGRRASMAMWIFYRMLMVIRKQSKRRRHSIPTSGAFGVPRSMTTSCLTEPVFGTLFKKGGFQD